MGNGNSIQRSRAQGRVKSLGMAMLLFPSTFHNTARWEECSGSPPGSKKCKSQCNPMKQCTSALILWCRYTMLYILHIILFLWYVLYNMPCVLLSILILDFEIPSLRTKRSHKKVAIDPWTTTSLSSEDRDALKTNINLCRGFGQRKGQLGNPVWKTLEQNFPHSCTFLLALRRRTIGWQTSSCILQSPLLRTSLNHFWGGCCRTGCL